jgi:Carbohydrate family 9 binding domain-like
MNALWWVMIALAAEGGYRVEPTTATARALLEGSDEAWSGTVRLDYGPGDYRTRFRARWNDDALFLRFDVSDPAPWHTMTKRDDPLWDEEVVEIFLDLDGSGTNYAEVELSPANVVCDVRMVRGSPDKQMDLSFNLEGLESRVVPWEGGWTGLLRLPWSGFRPLPSASHVALPPKPGDRWRFNVYRIERPHGKDHPAEGAIFASWSPTGSDSFHVPASFQTFELSAPER